MSLIVACDNDYGIGKDNKLPWHIPEDLSHFKGFTANKRLIAGATTYENLPQSFIDKNTIIPVGKKYKSFDEALTISGKENSVFIGGVGIYYEALFRNIVHTIVISRVDDFYQCDKNIKFIQDYLPQFSLYETQFLASNCTLFVYYSRNDEQDYLNLIN